MELAKVKGFMPHKSTILYKSIFVLNLVVLSFGLLACDPCRQLAELACNCRNTEGRSDEESRRQCISELSLASQHEYFATAKETGVCEQALKKCTCAKINNKDDVECGQYRLRA